MQVITISKVHAKESSKHHFLLIVLILSSISILNSMKTDLMSVTRCDFFSGTVFSEEIIIDIIAMIYKVNCLFIRWKEIEDLLT